MHANGEAWAPGPTPYFVLQVPEIIASWLGGLVHGAPLPAAKAPFTGSPNFITCKPLVYNVCMVDTLTPLLVEGME